MPRYRRWRVRGGVYFFTANLQDRRRSLLIDHIDVLRKAFRLTKARHPFRIDAIVVLPDHLHCIWALPPGDDDFSTRWMRIKATFSQGLPSFEGPRHSRVRSGEREVWQRRFWEHVIRDEDDFTAHADYIHYNPVKHKLCAHPIDWPHSSIHRYVEKGILKATWGTDGSPGDMELG
ncbi:MAG: transposase [Planctomycetes bacterium]|nr:transposase [Planctomycetota bacterium]NOG55981.1 transposase [Planctomycetota bacterium]